MTNRLAIVVAWIGALLFALGGIWALSSPHSFSTVIATYHPYNRHLFHDVGAFQLGIAAALAAGIAGRKPLAVGLWGGAVGATAHAASHWIDANLGPRSIGSNPVSITLIAVVLIAGLAAS
ncbi:MAG TPA: hypothetical protein VFA45_12415 [Actinomycetes bacterium]|jgi:hypothetical protein|nr:hypothetical protein [Actinomycetes bacterium]